MDLDLALTQSQEPEQFNMCTFPGCFGLWVNPIVNRILDTFLMRWSLGVRGQDISQGMRSNTGRDKAHCRS